MKNNKGFGSIAVLIIIVAVLAIGGIVYYEGKSSKTVPVVEENQVINNASNNKPHESNYDQNGEYIGYIKSISYSSGNYSLTIDYIQMNSCTPPSNGSGCENGYEIVNDNPLIRTFPIASNVNITTITKPTGDGLYSDPELHQEPISIEFFKPLFQNNMIWTQNIPFWITLNNGIITEITEQYIP